MSDPHIDRKYQTAFDGILTPAELQTAEKEAGEFEADLKTPGKIPRCVVRWVMDRKSDKAKEKLVAQGVEKADELGRDYSDIAAKLNQHQFVLNEEGIGLRHLKNPQELSDRFKPGHEDEWPTLVLVANSNLVSPQSFFDCFEGAKEVAPVVADVDPKEMVIAGTYYSERNFSKNALTTFKRYRELAHDVDFYDKNLSPAAQVQAYQLLDLLLERDANGRVLLEPIRDGKGRPIMEEALGENNRKIEVEKARPVLRHDAEKVMKHVIGYGYSAAHMTNKDAFRVLRQILLKGDVLMHMHDSPHSMVTIGEMKQIDKLFSKTRLIGVAGMDNMEKGPYYGMPREANFVHPGDLSLAVNGNAYLHIPFVVQIRSEDGSKSPLEKRHGGHDQHAYVKAILSAANEEAVEKAKEHLAGECRSVASVL
jgi:hypothetical protein